MCPRLLLLPVLLSLVSLPAFAQRPSVPVIIEISGSGITSSVLAGLVMISRDGKVIPAAFGTRLDVRMDGYVTSLASLPVEMEAIRSLAVFTHVRATVARTPALFRKRRGDVPIRIAAELLDAETGVALDVLSPKARTIDLLPCDAGREYSIARCISFPLAGISVRRVVVRLTVVCLADQHVLPVLRTPGGLPIPEMPHE